LALHVHVSQLDLIEGFNAKINQRQVSVSISFEPGPEYLEMDNVPVRRCIKNYCTVLNSASA
jgi:hypothetical protein